MKYYSTRRISGEVAARDAVFGGLPADNGLYMPGSIPVLSRNELRIIRNSTLQQIANKVLGPFFSDIPPDRLAAITRKALDFPIPLTRVSKDLYALELYHGPTMAFKDVGAGFLAGCLDHYAGKLNRRALVLVATSGDTGSAVANGFYGKDGIDVIILYPSGRISRIQEQQMTTLGGNIRAIEVDGTFDDCQAMVKRAFLDRGLNEKLTLTSANSINIARFLAQTVYYFHAWAQLPDDRSPVFSVPSGNFGNLTAGLVAFRMGLPAQHFIASTNINRTFPDFMETGIYRARPSITTISNAMDVGDPSNFVRIEDLFHGSRDGIISTVSSFSFTDEETLDCISRTYNKYGYITDPHGATGLLGLEKYAAGSPGIFLETAHPYKFREHVEKTIATSIPIPQQVKQLGQRKPVSIRLANDFQAFREFLLRY